MTIYNDICDSMFMTESTITERHPMKPAARTLQRISEFGYVITSLQGMFCHQMLFAYLKSAPLRKSTLCIQFCDGCFEFVLARRSQIFKAFMLHNPISRRLNPISRRPPLPHPQRGAALPPGPAASTARALLAAQPTVRSSSSSPLSNAPPPAKPSAKPKPFGS